MNQYIDEKKELRMAQRNEWLCRRLQFRARIVHVRQAIRRRAEAV